MGHVELPTLDPMPEAYAEHLRRAADACSRDPRVLALWITGAVARGVQDAVSDLDLCLTVADDEVEAFAEGHEAWIQEVVGPEAPVSVQSMPGVTGWFVLTAGCERVDVVVEPESSLGFAQAARIAVLDKVGLVDRLEIAPDPAPEPHVVDGCIVEALRQMANFPVVIARQDWLMGVVAVQQLHLLLYEICAQANRPQPVTGLKRWSEKLSPRHLRLLEGLPVPQPQRDSVVAAHRAAVDLFEQEAPVIATDVGIAWPQELHDAVRAYRGRAYPADW